MAQPYSYDLHQKVIQAIQLDGLKIMEASILFDISRNTIGLWLKRQAQTGDFLALLGRVSGNGHKITDWEKFRELASYHGLKPFLRSLRCTQLPVGVAITIKPY